MSLFKSVTEGMFKPKNNPSSHTVTEERVKQALSVVVDPDLHKDIVSLGFVKDIEISANKVAFKVELTTPACPAKELLKEQCIKAIKGIDASLEVDVVMTSKSQAYGSPSTQGQQGQAQSSLSRVARIIAVASGKGGVGKSTSALNLAYSLAKQGAKVGILDADVYGPSMKLMSGVGEPQEMNVQNHVIPPVIDGVKVISVAMFASAGKASILRGPMAAQIIKQFLTQVDWGELDYLIIDYPPGTGDIQLTISQLAPVSGAVIVTTPQEVALIDVRRAISMFETLKVPVIGVIETMSYFVCDGCSKKHSIFREGGGRRVAGEFGLPLLGEIPIEERVAKLCDEGKPLVTTQPDAMSTKAYLDAAAATTSQLSILQSKELGALQGFNIVWQKEFSEAKIVKHEASDVSLDKQFKSKNIDARVREISQIDERRFRIIWTDNFAQVFDVVTLRRKCPCAVCVDEWTHQRKLKDSDISETVRPQQIDSVGRYALQIKFDDGHGTGIYTFSFLRGC